MISTFNVISRPRMIYVVVCIMLIAVSLPARYTNWYPAFVVIYAADAVWAVMIYLLLAGIFPQILPVKLLAIAICGCWLVELSQLYQADWINDLRQWSIVGLLIGYGFRISDLVAYALGTGIGFLLDVFILRRIGTPVQD